MSSRDNGLWQQYWRDRRTDLHRTTVNPLLIRFWPDLDLEPGSRVLVPLCGKSLDMSWLIDQGYRVLGIELSPLAVRAYFRENRIEPTRRASGSFMRWGHGNLGILCGDLFSMRASDLGPIDAVYDHTAFTALPEDSRRTYVDQLERITPGARQQLLLTTEETDAGQSPEQASGTSEEILALYAEHYDIHLAHVETLTEPPAPERPTAGVYRKVYRLSRRTGAPGVSNSRAP